MEPGWLRLTESARYYPTRHSRALGFAVPGNGPRNLMQLRAFLLALLFLGAPSAARAQVQTPRAATPTPTSVTRASQPTAAAPSGALASPSAVAPVPTPTPPVVQLPTSTATVAKSTPTQLPSRTALPAPGLAGSTPVPTAAPAVAPVSAAPSAAATPRALSRLEGVVYLDGNGDRLLGNDETGIGGVEVWLVSPDQPGRSARTDEYGRFIFAEVPLGRYQLLARPPVGLATPEQPRLMEVSSTESQTRVELRMVAEGDLLPADENSSPIAEEMPFDWGPFIPTDQPDHLATIERAAAESRCGIPWQILAAIARVESNFGRNMNVSSAGALGYGQFMPDSWAFWGQDGNPYDYRDTLPAMARYLCDHGAERDLRAALWGYNHAEWYVDLVLRVAADYDQGTPIAPSEAILDRPVPQVQGRAPRYAPGRSTLADTRVGPRPLVENVTWLGVPFRPRPELTVAATRGQAAATAALRMALAFYQKGETAVVGEQRAALLTAPGEPRAALTPSDPLESVADASTAAGLTVLDLRREDGTPREWTIDALRWHVAQGRPVIVAARQADLPGHTLSGSDDDGESEIVIIGTTPDGVIYHDGAFATTLGYGLEMSNEEIDRAWAGTRLPRHAMALTSTADAAGYPFPAQPTLAPRMDLATSVVAADSPARAPSVDSATRVDHAAALELRPALRPLAGAPELLPSIVPQDLEAPVLPVPPRTAPGLLVLFGLVWLLGWATAGALTRR